MDHNYFITVFQTENDSEYKYKRNWGYFRDLARAERAIYENWTDMYEVGYYDIALIEKISEGLCQCAFEDERWWFRIIPELDKDGCITNKYIVTRTDEPKWAKNMVGYANG